MVKVRSQKELELMRQSGRISGLALKKVVESVRPGISGLELEKIATDEIAKLGGRSSFKTVDGYNWTTCITVNDQVVHGIPTERKLKEGDIVSIDLGTVYNATRFKKRRDEIASDYKGWHTDTAWSVVVGQADESVKKFLQVGEEALWKGIEKAVDGNKTGDIGAAIQNKVEGSGYSVVRSLVGHGVGRQLHEDPEVPGFGKPGTGSKLKSGQTIAVEVIYNMGKSDVALDRDGWTISSADGSLAGLFEMSLIVAQGKPEVLTYNLKSGRMVKP